MKRVFAGTFVAAAFAASLSAQQTPPQSQPMQEAKDAGKTVTVTGCLKAGDTADSYLLSELKWGQDKAVGTTGGATPATPATPPVAATTLKLIGSPTGTKLSEHVGHMVEVSGTIEKADRPSTPATPADPAARPAPSASAQPALNVRNVKMVSATCTAK